MRYLFVLLLLAGSPVFAQDLPDEAPEPQQGTRDWYLKRSKSQKTAAWIMAGAGVLTSVIGAASSVSSIDFSGQSKNKVSGGEVAFFIGAGVAVGSIPLFIASGRNKRKGLSMSVQKETSYRPDPRQQGSFAAVRLSLSF